MRDPRGIGERQARSAATAGQPVKNAGSGARPMPAATPAPVDPGPLTVEQLSLLERAFERRQILARAVTLARANGIGLFVTAFLALLCSFFQPSLVAIAVVLGTIGWVELRGARMLQRLDLRAPAWLARNQLALLLAVAIYCAFAIYSGLHSTNPLADLANTSPEMSAQLDELSQSLGGNESSGLTDHVYPIAVVGFYLTVLAGCALYQGLCAYFYAKRAAVLRAHVELTPPWVLQLQRRVLGW